MLYDVTHSKTILSKRKLKDLEEDEQAPNFFYTTPRGLLKSEVLDKSDRLKQFGIRSKLDREVMAEATPEEIQETSKSLLNASKILPLFQEEQKTDDEVKKDRLKKLDSDSEEGGEKISEEEDDDDVF